MFIISYIGSYKVILCKIFTGIYGAGCSTDQIIFLAPIL